jgi:serine/threonine protein kinase
MVFYDGFVTVYRARGVRHSGEVLLHEYFPAACASRDDDGSIRASMPDREFEYSRGSKRFLELAGRLAEVQHANVAEVTDVLALNGTGYLVTADLQAESLQQRYAIRQRFSADEVLSMALAILAGLERVHLAGLIHGDIGESSIRFKGAVPQLVHSPAALLANFRRMTMAVPSIDPRLTPAPADSESTPDIYEFGLLLHRLAKGKSARNDLGPDDPSGALMRAVLRVIERAFSGPREFRPRSAGEWRGEFEMVRDLPGAEAR